MPDCGISRVSCVDRALHPDAPWVNHDDLAKISNHFVFSSDCVCGIRVWKRRTLVERVSGSRKFGRRHGQARFSPT